VIDGIRRQWKTDRLGQLASDEPVTARAEVNSIRAGSWPQPVRRGAISERGVEVNHSRIRFPPSKPIVDGLSPLLNPGIGASRRPFLRQNRSHPYLAAGPKAARELLEASDDVCVGSIAKVVGAEENNAIGDSLHRRNIARQRLKCVIDTLPRNCGADNRYPQHSLGNHRPAVLDAIMPTDVSLGDAIADGDDCPA